MTDPNGTPIVVNPDQTMAQLGVAVRYAITLVGGYLVGKGWIDGDLVQVIATALTALVPAAYAVWRSSQQKKALVKITQSASDDVAVIKGASA